MERKGLAIFDGDDTLWIVEPLYDDALRRIKDILDGLGLPGEQWRMLQRELDLENVQKLGMSPERFPLSSRQALLELGQRLGKQIPTSLLREIEAISKSVFEATAPVLPSAAEVLSALESAFHLVLLTKGDRRVQERRIEKSHLAERFEQIKVVGEKEEWIFKQLAADFHVAPDDAWSIGNSLASDVNPALRAGLNAIWIDAHVWEHERRDVAPADTRVVVLDTLDQVPQVLLPFDREST
jgi:putative hydrolase of the HAD superfamily